MTTLSQGANVSLNAVAQGQSTVGVELQWSPATIGGGAVDASAFLLGANGKVLSDDYFVFYNQPTSGDSAVTLRTEQGKARFSIDFARLNPAVERIAFVATLDGAGARFGSAQSAVLLLTNASGSELVRYDAGVSGRQEAALTFGELYKRAGEWKLRAVGQGFNGGLKPLAESYGVVVDESAPAAPPPPKVDTSKQSSAIRLEKRLIDLEKKDPGMVKRLNVTLEKKGLEFDSAKVALVLDISPSMVNLFDNGSVDELVKRVLALGLRFDDDGQIDVFLFGRDAYSFGTVDVSNYRTFVRTAIGQYGYSPGTYYGRAMALVRETYDKDPQFGKLPVYIMFITDGGTADPAASEKHIIETSGQPFFWQFLAIGKPPNGQKKQGRWAKVFGSGFDFLEKLDNLPGRVIDNASFSIVENPAHVDETEMFEMLMEEYPGWVKQAQQKGILRP